MSDPLIDDANAISTKSPAIRTFAQHAASKVVMLVQLAALASERIIALDARLSALEKPPVPVPATHRNGLILFRYADSWRQSPASGYARYGVVVVGYGNDHDAALLPAPTLALGYRTPVELEDVADAALSSGGVTLAQARANGWLLKDAGGHELVVPDYPGEWCGNLSHPGYQAACYATYKARAAATGARGFFLDNVDSAPWFSGAPANVYGGMSFDAAYVSFLAGMRAALPDLYFLANVYSTDPTFLPRIAPYVNGAMVETFTGSPAQLATIKAGQDAGLEMFALSFDDPASAEARARAQAFASVWNRKGGGFGINIVGPDPFDLNWTQALA